MAGSQSPAAQVLEALGFALFSRDENQRLVLAAEAPPWLKTLWPNDSSEGAELPVERASPFLENFLIDAEECWRAAGEERVSSGPWIERDAAGGDVELEATALTARGRSVLLLERLGGKLAEKKSVLQKARETVIAYQRLNAEIQKKQVLLHLVADEMNAAVANVITSLRLIEMEEKNPPRTRSLLGLASRATEEQQELVHKVLRIFAPELSQLFGQDGGRQAADLTSAMERAIETLRPRAQEKSVVIEYRAADIRPRISAHPEQVERVILNLAETSLDQSGPGNAITLEVSEDADGTTMRVRDNATPIAPEIADHLFTEQITPDTPPALALRAQFCRMVMEACEGEVFYEPAESGGNSFCLRWPKEQAA